MKYSYIASDNQGKHIKGIIVSDSPEQAMMELGNQGLFPVEIRPVTSFSLPGRSKRLSPRELMRLYRDLSRTLRAGLRLSEGFRTLEESLPTKNAREAVKELRTLVEEGTPISESMQLTGLFPESHIAAVRAAEASGKLAEALAQLAESIGLQEKLKGEIRGALTYPVMILSLSVVIAYFLLTRLVPRILNSLHDVGLKQLPTPTRITVGISNFLQDYGAILLILLVLVSLIVWSYAHTERGKRQVDQILLSIPVISDIIRNLALVNVLNTLVFLLKSGVRLTQSLEIAANTSSNTVISQAILDIKRLVEEGTSIGDAMAMHKTVLTPQVVAAAKVGESAANLYEPFAETATHIAEDTRDNTIAMVKLLEPATLVLLAALIGVIVLSIFMPMYDLLNQLQVRGR